MKKGKKVVVAPSHAAGPVVHGGDRARFKYQSLLQDYEELLKETEAKRKKLHMEKLRKQKLLTEVKFLRRRHISLSENPSQTAVYRVKKLPMPPPSSRVAVWTNDDAHRPVQAVSSPSKGPSLQRRQDFTPRTSPVIDLNEACEPSSEEMEEFNGFGEPVRVDKVKKYPMEGDAGAGPSDVKMPAFWDVRNAAGRVGKRKISWQDQLALRV